MHAESVLRIITRALIILAFIHVLSPLWDSKLGMVKSKGYGVGLEGNQIVVEQLSQMRELRYST